MRHERSNKNTEERRNYSSFTKIANKLAVWRRVMNVGANRINRLRVKQSNSQKSTETTEINLTKNKKKKK